MTTDDKKMILLVVVMALVAGSVAFMGPAFAESWVSMPKPKDAPEEIQKKMPTVWVDRDSIQTKAPELVKVHEKIIFPEPRTFKAVQHPTLKNALYKSIKAEREYDCARLKGRPTQMHFFNNDGKEILQVLDPGPWDAPMKGTASFAAMSLACTQTGMKTARKI